MAQIVDLDLLVGGDLVFKYDGGELRIPGDISTELVFGVFHAFRELHDVSEEGKPEEVERANASIREQLLQLFQIRQPEMKSLPFGIKTTPIVIQEILSKLGVNVREEGDAEEETGKVVPLPKRQAVPKQRRRSRAQTQTTTTTTAQTPRKRASSRKKT